MELIKIIKHQGKDSVSARDLYDFLGFDSGNWSRWSKQNIEENNFAQHGEDFTGFFTMKNGNETKDYALTFDFAKRLCMMAKTEKGEQARSYFIQCEKKLHEVFQIPKTYSEALMLAAQQAQQIELQTKMIEEQRPKVEFFDTVADSKEAFDMRQVAAVLNIPSMGRNKIFEVLRNYEVLDDNNLPYRKFQDAGYFRVIEQKYCNKHGEPQISLKTLVYQKGLDYIRKVIARELP